MALLKIIKLSTKTWKHNSDVDGDFILTKFYAKQENNEFLLVETYGAKRRKYLISEIEVYDIGGTAETFSNFTDLFLRLEALKYPAFYVDGEFTFNPASYDLSEFANDGTDKFVKESEVLSNDISTYTPATTPLAGTELALINDATGFKKVAVSEFVGDLQSVTDKGNTTTNNITTGKITTPMVKLPKGSYNVDLYPVDLTANRKLEAPNKNGIIATLDDIPSNPITGTGANGQVAFFNGTNSQTGDNGLFWDNTNKRLGVGTSSPNRRLTVNGIVTASNESPTVGDGAFVATGGNPTIVQTLQRTSGAFAYAMFKGFANNTTTGLTSPLVDYGVLGDVHSGVTPPNLAYSYFSVGSSSAYNNTYMRLHNNAEKQITVDGRLSIGTTASISGARLDVRAQGALSTDIALRVRNSADTANLMTVDGTGLLSTLSITLGNPSLDNNIRFGGNNTRIFNSASDNSLNFQNVFSASTIFRFRTNSDLPNTNTSGTNTFMSLPIGFAPTSGTGTWTQLSLTGTINQTGGANGITRGLYINQTLTSAFDFRAIEVSSGGVYVNTTNVQASAILQADSTTKGFLPPRMTNAQRTAIASPAVGLIVYCTDTTEGLYINKSTGWTFIG